MNRNKKILVAPLNWGLGHASRCIPIIYALKKLGFIPVIASDGAALHLLQNEFPEEIFETLPNFKIEYSEKGKNFKYKIAKQLPKLVYIYWKERKILKKIITKHNLSGIISDNRPSVFSSKIPSVYITHQVNVLSGNTSWFSSKLHHYFIKKYINCWVPDVAGSKNLSGVLSHNTINLKNIIFIGPITRFTKKKLHKKNKLLVILSGPEPQRTLLEEKLIHELVLFKGNVLFVKGIVENVQKIVIEKNITFYNFMNSEELDVAIQESEFVICRSGYSSIMDLAFLNAKVLLIPTPGQFEQEYLAEKLYLEKRVPCCPQHLFTLNTLLKIDAFSGFETFDYTKNWEQLFACFEGK